ncbi:MAG TPA: bifunctional [glutamine synthetase] adenylyltransferase/[glutamine synthetase]-adenylyl-L-tyrosine phosphorylase [Stellaceae bacterium]|nr:bifunctional [glutamine synthetase] adenylyltransferase/[glutamine synthetase]-adenylyl-L-tyrosine phosphorylase [Stellaceae bacterium]
MRPSLPSLDVENLPAPADPGLAALGVTRWRERADEIDDAELADCMRALADHAGGARLLASLFGNSPFLTQCCLKEPGFLMRLLQTGSDATFAEVEAALNRDLESDRDRPSLMRRLRVGKRRAALVVAIADIAQWWPLERVTAALSEIAERALCAGVRHLLRAAAAHGEIELKHPDDPARDSGLIVLGMGKLGARELNYSSDIDLIVLFDTERVRYVGRHSPHQLFARLARDLVRLLDEHTEDGYVFRTDLRLRPDPASTPPALSVMAALTYYESAGQNWERAALIKARPVAGDIEAGFHFLTELRPFLWRKNLDFAAIQDIHSIKRQIHAHRGGGRIAVLGHNVKLGRGGIREIEFFAQTQQLIWGGRLPAVRVAGTCAALTALAEIGRVTPAAAEEMTQAYQFLRRVEHRLQMIEDQQVHSLPTDEAGLAKIATFLGYRSVVDFRAELLHQLATVEGQYAHLFEESPSLSGPGNLVFTGSEDDPDTLSTLRGLGYGDPSAAAAIVRGWHHGRYRAMRSQRARELMTELIPTLLAAFGRTSSPDTALRRFDQLMERLPAGVQILSLFHANPSLLHMVAEIIGGVPRLADQLAQRPGLLDGMLSADFLDPLPSRQTLARELGTQLDTARDTEDLLDIARRWTHDKRFQIGVQIIRGLIDGPVAGAAFADVAETVIAAMLSRIASDMARAHGTIAGGEAVVIALGKLGGREMTVTSDLDLVLIYDAPEAAENSDGPRPLPVSTYYMRLWQRVVNALTALTAEGTLYEVDMRLRPSGTKGPLATSLAAFQRYHVESAWTWEHMALTRARPVAGSPALAERIIAEIRTVLTRPRDADRLVVDVADMRQRIAEQHQRPPIWEAKHRRGGLVDIEFVAQYLQLRRAHDHPSVLRQNTGDALQALMEATLLDRATTASLLEALDLWRNVQGLIKLCVDEPFDEAAASPALRAILAGGTGAIDFEHLKADMSAAAARVRTQYATLVARPAAAARRRLGIEEPPGTKATEDETA